MESSNESLKNVAQQKFEQCFNYHTHTSRCGHAAITSDKEYVLSAFRNGITELGFSDHIPSCEFEFSLEDVRMFYYQMDDYIKSINELKNQFSDMNILVGFEAEFDSSKEKFLCECRKKVDYMVLGQRFITGINPKNNPNYPIHYAKVVCKAIDSGIFDMIAHPDIFMRYRNSLTTEEGKKQFLENSIIASQMICERAKVMGIPVEINFGGIKNNQIYDDGELEYPHSLFWREAGRTGVKVIFGVDAHDPKMFNKLEDYFNCVLQIIPSELKIISEYNPLVERKCNDKLQQAYVNVNKNSLPYEYYLMSQIVNQAVLNQKEEDIIDSEVFVNSICKYLSYLVDKCTDTVLKNEKHKLELISSLENDSFSIENKFKIKRLNDSIDDDRKVLINQQNVLEKLKKLIMNVSIKKWVDFDDFIDDVMITVKEELFQNN